MQLTVSGVKKEYEEEIHSRRPERNIPVKRW